jgi:uncharacterized protein
MSLTPVTTTYPGVYVAEQPSGVRTISGVATSITAFVGRARRGPVDEPVRISSWADFERVFGGLWEKSHLGYSVNDFFRMGGGAAVIVRVHNDRANDTAQLAFGSSANALTLAARSPGTWGSKLTAVCDNDVKEGSDTKTFNLTVTDPAGLTETFRNVSVATDSMRRVDKVVNAESSLVKITQTTLPSARPPSAATVSGGANDGDPITAGDIASPTLLTNKRGMYALEKTDLFNLLVVPPYLGSAADDDITDPGNRNLDNDVVTAARDYAKDRRAVAILDPPAGWRSVADAEAGVKAAPFLPGSDGDHAAMYFPRIHQGDPLRDGQVMTFAPSGAVAGIIADTDANRGVWKSPAGLEAALNGVSALSVPLTDPEIGRLNPLGLNCLRLAPGSGHVVWGARTRDGADTQASEWKYLAVRRTALFLEESLFRGLQWVVFEPNDEPLWAQIRLNIGAFLNTLFRQGAFQGSSPRDAYFVKCDKDTTTQNDINLGVVNIMVGFAPLKPAEFVVLRLQQMAGQINA